MKRFLLLIGFLGLLVLPVFSQDVEPPSDWLAVLANMPTWFGTLAGLAAITVFLGSVVTSLLKITKPWGKQVAAWLVAILLCFISNLVNFGMLAEATWVQTLVYGLGAGLIANGIFDFTVVQMILQFLKLELKKP